MLAGSQIDFENGDSETGRFVGIIQRNSKRINDLITELLQTSQPASGYFEETDLAEVLNAVIAFATDRLNLLHICLNKEIAEMPVWVYADASSLRLALQNIMMNAIEAINHERGQIDICLKKLSVFVS